MIKKILYDKLNGVCIGNYYITDDMVVESSVSHNIYRKVIDNGSMTLGEFTIKYNKEEKMFTFVHEIYNLTFYAQSSLRFLQIFQKLFSILEVY